MESNYNSNYSPPTGTQSENPNSQTRLALENRMQSGANWFFWIAGLSLINTILAMTQTNLVFVVGLGITQIFDEIASPANALIINIFIAGIFMLFGFMGRKQRNWGFIVGIIVYILDALLLLTAQEWMSVGFHAFALFYIFGGLKASKELQKIPAKPASSVAY